MSTGSVLVAAAGSAVTFMLIAALVVGLKWLARYFERQEQRDRAKAEAEGAAAVERGELPQANPYLGERSDHFRGMSEAWNRGYTRAPENRREVPAADMENLRAKVDGSPIVRAAIRSALDTIKEKDRVNTKQRRIAIATLAAIVLALAFPPFQIHLQNGIVTNLGYAFIFSPPNWEGLVGSVDVGMLVAEWLAVVLVGATLFWLSKDG